MARSNSYDFTRQDVDEMFNAIEETLNEAREEFYKKHGFIPRPTEDLGPGMISWLEI